MVSDGDTVTLWDWPAGTARLTVTVPFRPGDPPLPVRPGDPPRPTDGDHVLVNRVGLSPARVVPTASRYRSTLGMTASQETPAWSSK